MENDRYIVHTHLIEARAATERDALSLARILIIETNTTGIQLIDSVTSQEFCQITASMTYEIKHVLDELLPVYLYYSELEGKTPRGTPEWLGYRDVVQALSSPDHCTGNDLVHKLELYAQDRELSADAPGTIPWLVQFHMTVAGIYRKAVKAISKSLGASAVEDGEQVRRSSCGRANRHLLKLFHPRHEATQTPLSSVDVQEYQHRTDGCHMPAVRSLCWLLDSSVVVSAGGVDDVTFWDTLTEGRRDIIPDSRFTDVLALSPDGSFLALGAYQQVRLLRYPGHFFESDETESPVLRKKQSGHVGQVVWGPDGTTLLSCSGSDVTLWRRSSGKAIRRYCTGSGNTVETFALSPNGSYLAVVVWSGDASDTVEVRDVATGSVLTTYRGHARGIRAVAWLPNSEWIVSVASGYDDHSAHVWHAATGRQRLVYAAHTDGVTCVSIAAQGEYAVTGGYDKTVRIWSTVTGETAQVFNQGEGISRIAVAPSGMRVASGDFSGRVFVWPVQYPGGNGIHTLSHVNG